jgi:uncharacterized membrane protein YheB (UPF0754 family)
MLQQFGSHDNSHMMRDTGMVVFGSSRAYKFVNSRVMNTENISASNPPSKTPSECDNELLSASVLLMPLIAGVIGYLTNVLALYMTFYPYEYYGAKLFRIPTEPWGLFGWQGIIPTKARKMAGLCYDLMTTRLFTIREVFDRLDPERFAAVMSDPVLLLLDRVISEVAMEYFPSVWERLPDNVKDDIVVTTSQESSVFLTNVVRDMQANIDDIVDLKTLTVEKCVEQKQLIVQVFLECGEKEFIFIRRSGFYFGFIFGMFQMILWHLFPAVWVMPVAGFIVGWLTNWLALKVIFRPLHPVKFFGWTIQGLFLKRQAEVSETFARVVINEIMHVRAIWESILTGPLSKNFEALMRVHTLVFTDTLIAELKPLAVAGLGAEVFHQMKEDIATKVIAGIPSIIDRSYAYTQEALDMETTVREKMKILSPPEFEGVL